MLILIGAAYPVFIRQNEWRQLDTADWLLSALFVAAGIAAAVHFARTMMVSDDGIRFGKKTVAWNRITRVEVTDDKVILTTADGERDTVSLDLKNVDRFLVDLRARFDAEGRPLG
jgi:uncharacterized membrane protein YobD (UPF0266 family)